MKLVKLILGIVVVDNVADDNVVPDNWVVDVNVDWVDAIEAVDSINDWVNSVDNWIDAVENGSWLVADAIVVGSEFGSESVGKWLEYEFKIEDELITSIFKFVSLEPINNFVKLSFGSSW